MKYTMWMIMGMAGMLSVFFPGLLAAQPQYEEVIVNFVDQASQEMVQAIAQEYGLTLEYNSIFSKEEALLRFPVGTFSQEQLQTLMQLLTAEEEIEYAEPNYLYQTMKFPNDPLYAKQWNMNMLHIEDAWKAADGKGAVVAVIDTGVAFEDYKDKKGVYHRVPDLAQTEFVPGYDFIDDDEHANDDHGHGTHVAGTIAQSTNNAEGVTGIAYKAEIMPLKVLSRSGIGNIADIAEAIVYAADHGAHVINMSLGGGGESLLMREAVEYAHNKGVTVVCAAAMRAAIAPVIRPRIHTRLACPVWGLTLNLRPIPIMAKELILPRRAAIRERALNMGFYKIQLDALIRPETAMNIFKARQWPHRMSRVWRPCLCRWASKNQPKLRKFCFPLRRKNRTAQNMGPALLTPAPQFRQPLVLPVWQPLRLN